VHQGKHLASHIFWHPISFSVLFWASVLCLLLLLFWSGFCSVLSCDVAFVLVFYAAAAALSAVPGVRFWPEDILKQ
jgi:hypothetical protein